MSTPEAPPVRRRWLILAVIGIAQLMVILDNSIVNIALPSAQADLGFDDAQRQWIITAYALAFGSLLLLGGRLSDLFGRKRAFLVGLVGFAVASILGGLAPGFELLVAARALQGVFGALLAPAALSLLTTTFTEGRERARAFGVFAALAGSGAAIGLLLGGALTQYVDWRWCMYVNAVFAAVAFVGASLLLPAQPVEHRPHLDVVGTVLASAGLFSVVYGFASAETDSWTSPLVYAFLAAGLVLLVAFVLVQRRVKAPLLPLRVVLDRFRGGSFLTILVLTTGMFGVTLFLAYVMQQVFGFSPLMTGVAFLPMVACIVLAANTVPAILLPRTGPKPLVVVGMLLGAGGLFWFSFLTPESGYAAHVLGPLLMIGLGMGTAMSTSINTATYGVEPGDAGVASASVNTMQQVGGSVGTALLSSIAGTAAAGFAVPPLAAALHGYTTAFTVAAGIFVVGAVVVGFLIPAGRTTARSAVTTRTASTEAGEPAEPAEPVGTGLVGAVRDGGGRAVAGATLTLVDTAGHEAGRAVTDDAGDYTLRARPGDHLLVAGAAGRAPTAQQIVLTDGLTTRGDVVLDPTPEPART
ncbi:MFS transporter [Actinomycetospora chibensis]|uniref:MFS transporter n=1 Tax=Actinomycetospora chibensis TaxID=663606 RepID=A0ABV9RQD0_9PSEU